MQPYIERPTNRKNAHDLHCKYIKMAREALLKGDRVLFDDYYQRAEYYLRLMNKLSNNFSGASKLPFNKNLVTRKNIQCQQMR